MRYVYNQSDPFDTKCSPILGLCTKVAQSSLMCREVYIGKARMKMQSSVRLPDEVFNMNDSSNRSATVGADGFIYPNGW